MKMEVAVATRYPGRVAALYAKPGQTVLPGQILAVIRME
jgi:biotin carboxyl carrier protein